MIAARPVGRARPPGSAGGTGTGDEAGAGGRGSADTSAAPRQDEGHHLGARGTVAHDAA